MNVALLHYSAPPIVGGVESVLAHQARLMAAAGHKVQVIAARGEAWAAEIEFNRIPLVDSRHPEILLAKSSLDAGEVPHGFGKLVDELLRQLQVATRGVNVLIAHNVCSLNKNLALTAALRQLCEQPGAPRLVLWHHDLAWTTPRYRHELHDGFPWDLLRSDWPCATQVVVSSLRQKELSHLLKIPQERVHVVPNGMEVPTFLKLEPETTAWMSRLDLLAAAPLLLLPVRITPRKNLELALQVLSYLRRDFPQAVLLVTGPLGAHNPANEEYFARLLRLRADLGLNQAAHFLAELTDAYLPDVMIADFYRLADALLLPSREEGFGIPLIEAALSQRPVFCTDLAPLQALGLADVQYFSPDASPKAVASLISQSLHDSPTFRLAVRIRQNYTWEQIYRQKIEPILQGALH